MTRRQMRPRTIRDLLAEAAYSSLEHIVAGAFEAMVPSERLTVTEAALRYTRVPAGGAYGRPWELGVTPYLQEPQDVLTSLDKQGMIFVGPARTGKTVMLLNWVGHTVKHDPTDMLYVHMNRDNARKWSKGDLDRFLHFSTAIRSEQLTNRKDDNTFDKEFRSGMRFLLTYPTVENLSGITVKYVGFIDYDRMDDDVDGEGTPFDLGRKRTTTFKRFAMSAAESSPNPDKEITDPKWIPESPHQAPPIRGIFELYNRGDRRRWNWNCPCCGEGFEPDFSLIKWPDSDDMMESAEGCYMVCPHNGCIIEPGQKQELNDAGKWVPEGYMLSPGGMIVPRPGVKPARSDIASFWLKGPAAGYQTWPSLVLEELRAQEAYEKTGDEGPLRKTRTTDQGTYYIAKARLSERSPEDLKNRAEFWGSTEDAPTVPEGVAFLVATVDVQARAFVVQINGFTPAGDLVVVDGYKLRWSERFDANGERLPVDPAAFPEDWDLLVSQVLHKTYPLADESGRHMAIRALACDSGGREGVTANAYDFWRKLRKAQDGSHRRVILVKGDTSPSRPRAMTTWPDASKKDKFAGARGDVPVLLLQSNFLKDQLAGMLARRTGDTTNIEGSEAVGMRGMVRYPNWMPDWFYKQMTNEIRTPKGWDNPAQRRNETFDLSYYAIGTVIRPREVGVPFVHFGLDRIDFSDPPGWAAPWDTNDLVYQVEADDPEAVEQDAPQKDRRGRRSISDLASSLL